MKSAVRTNILKVSEALFEFKSNPFVPQRACLTSSVAIEAKEQDAAWNSARPFREVPGPTMWELFKFFRPGGSMANMGFFNIVDEFQRRYGNICKLPGILGKSDMVFVYDPNDVERIFRNEGKYPERHVLQSMVHYRTKIRPGIYAKSPGLTIAQGKEWWDFRQKVNPVMMQPKATKVYVPKIDQISKDFVNKIREKKDSNNKFPEFLPLLSKWALESVCYVSLNLRIGLMEDKANPRAEEFMTNLKRFFKYSYELDILPSVWMYYKTPLFKAMVKNADEMHDNAMYFLEQGKRALEEKKQLGIVTKEEDKGVLEKLLEIDESVAMVMTLDSIIVGVDTTSAALFQLLHTLALNPDKQEILRKEILTVLPNKDSKLTAENTKNLPYLRACMKESARYKPFFDNFRSTGCDIVLQGYQIPKSTNMSLAVHSLLKSEDHYVRSAEFLPERFLRYEGEMGCTKAKEPNPFIFIPFGYGPRMCVGRRFAELEIETLIANMLRQFKVQWDGPPPTYLNSFGQFPVGETHFTFTELKD